MKVAIFDLDNCLSDDGWRLDKIRWDETDPVKRYADYHAACGGDPPGNLAVLAQWAQQTDAVFFFTGRPELCRERTARWINDALPGMREKSWTLFMRSDSDRRGSRTLKSGMLDEIILHHDPCVAFDDHPEIVRMYIGRGIAATRLAIHDGDAYNPPKANGVPALLRGAADLFEERNAQYGNGYKRYGALLLALLPEGGIPAATTPEEATRLNLLMMCLAKLQRYANNVKTGGHRDSARDLQVYAAMLEESTDERPNDKLR